MSDYPQTFRVGSETVYGTAALLDLAKRLMAERDEARQNTFGPPSGDPRTAGGGMCHAESDTTSTGVESVNATASGYHPTP